MTDSDRLTLITWQAREHDRDRIGPFDLLDLLDEHGRIDVRVRAPLSRWVAGPRYSQDSQAGEHPRVQEMCSEGRMRHVRVGPRQRAGEFHGRVTRVARAPRRVA
jgi:hypothetical protein